MLTPAADFVTQILNKYARKQFFPPLPELHSCLKLGIQAKLHTMYFICTYSNVRGIKVIIKRRSAIWWLIELYTRMVC